MQTKNLRLPLERKWFELTKAGIKKEDYREITPYWCSRLLRYEGYPRTVKWWADVEKYEGSSFGKAIKANIKNGSIDSKLFHINVMPLGYPKSTDTERITKLEHKGIEIRTGNPEWGAELNKLYFVIKHGEIIK